MPEVDLVLHDGRTLHAYDAGPDAGSLAVLWHHGTPGLGELPDPLAEVTAELGLRWFGYDRPGYGGSTRAEGRDVAAAADDVQQLTDALGIDRFATLGASGGGPHALACAALLPDRVTAVVTAAGLAPFDAPGLSWFEGMYTGGAAELHAAEQGAEVLAAHLAASDFDPEMFVASDVAALEGAWGWLGSVAGRALATGLDGMVDDDLAFVRPWGFEVGDVRAPVLLLHGADDRVVPPAHSAWVAAHLPGGEHRVVPDAGHVAVLRAAADACRWLATAA
ncbi:alpha/beta hydrolase [Jatrophihabitans endophyticus]|uniref:alpha/beta fold hydrolase n=1 Tax=Jatrophihabitans endophyticus TaxID=1206085 RepID=UPI0019E42079|nr:alpha/beta hydrolase [Jatrophihabitans endophyticus]MBE7189440.1 alpha/beta hydrolase [Jatrophihabitans endophyticus]